MENLPVALSPQHWILIHGNARSGTGYMSRFVSQICDRSVADWGLRDLLIAATGNWHAKINARRLLIDISNNILASAKPGSGTQFDLVFKQAILSPDEYRVLVKIWGEPAQTIYCFRSPDEFIDSAIKKYPNVPEARLQKMYENQMGRFDQTGGRLFEYHGNLSTEDYLKFLSPIKFDKTNLEPFEHKGISDKRRVTKKMWDIYTKFLEINELQQA